MSIELFVILKFVTCLARYSTHFCLIKAFDKYLTDYYH